MYQLLNFWINFVLAYPINLGIKPQPIDEGVDDRRHLDHEESRQAERMVDVLSVADELQDRHYSCRGPSTNPDEYDQQELQGQSYFRLEKMHS